MKKTLLLLIIALCFNNLQAQTEKGSFCISGSSSFNTSFKNVSSENNSFETDFTQITISPSAGYFIAKDLLLGLDIIYIQNKTKQGKDFSSKNSSFGFMPCLKYYIPSKDNLRFYLKGGFGWQTYKSDFGGNNDGTLYGLGAGLAYFFKNNLSLDFGIDYMRSRKDVNDGQYPIENVYGYGYYGNDNGDHIIESTVNLRIGISIYF